jgi:hypothetical protein
MEKASWEKRKQLEINNKLDPDYNYTQIPQNKGHNKEALSLNAVGKGLILYRGYIYVGNKELLVLVLVDLGASYTFISHWQTRQLVEDILYWKIKLMDIKLPNGENMTTRKCYWILLCFGRWTASVNAWELETDDHDIILGQDWLCQFEPHICWRSGLMSISERG